jgi:hypothetical protein
MLTRFFDVGCQDTMEKTLRGMARAAYSGGKFPVFPRLSSRRTLNGFVCVKPPRT